MKQTSKRAFTLVEALIVLAILGLIYSLVSPVIQGNRDKSAYEISVINLGSVAKAMEHHYLEKGVYPVFSNWDEISGPDSPLTEYITEVPATDKFNRKYNVKESTEKGYIFEGFAIEGKLGKEYPDYNYSTGAKLKKGKPKS